MSSALFPRAALPGLVLASRVSYEETTIQRGDTGTEYRVGRSAARRYRYIFELRCARDAYGERQILDGFHAAHGGMRDSFLLVDPVDGMTRRVRFDDDELEFVRVVTDAYTCEFDLVTVIG